MSKCSVCRGKGYVFDTELCGEIQEQSGPAEKCDHCVGTGEIAHVEMNQIQVNALYFLAEWALKQHLPPLSVIGACDCVYHIAKSSGMEWNMEV